MEIVFRTYRLKNNWIWLLIMLTGSLFLIWPITMVLVRLKDVTYDSFYHLTNALLPVYLVNSFGLVVGVALVSMIIGVGTAWIVSTCEFPGRKSFEWLLILPLSIPTFINAIAYSGFTDYAGPIRIFLRSSGSGDIYLDIMNIWGVIFVMSMVLYPYVYLTARTAFSTQSGALIEASRTLGLSSWRIFFKVVIPSSWPAIFAGLILVIMEVLNDYGTVKYFGVPTFTTGIFKSWLSLGDLPSATLLASILMGMVLLLLWMEERWRGRRNYSGNTISRITARYRPAGLKKITLFCALSVPLVFGFLIPFGVMLWWLTLTFAQTQWVDFLVISGNTLSLGFLACLIIVSFGLIMSYSNRIVKGGVMLKWINKASLLGYAMPGAVISIGIIAAILVFGSQYIYMGIYALLFGYFVRFFAVGYNPIESGFSKQSLQLDDAAMTMGKGRLGTLFSVHLPLIKNSIIASIILIFVDVTKELPITLILRPFNFDTLATNAFQYATDEMAPESAAASILIIVVGFLPIYLLNRSMNNESS